MATEHSGPEQDKTDLATAFQWVVRFLENWPTGDDTEISGERMDLAHRYYCEGVDPWEAASAIWEGREPPRATLTKE